MDKVSPLPQHGSVFFDPRDEDRQLRVSYHSEQDVFVLSLWRRENCLGTFRLPAADAARFVHVMVSSLAEQSDTAGIADTQVLGA
jgi:hypothetical protein